MSAIQPLEYDLLDETRAFISEPTKLLINGDWVASDSGKTNDVFDPATGKVFCEAYMGGASDIDKAVNAARAAFENPAWSRMPAYERQRLMWRLADLMEENAQLFNELEVLDNGLPMQIAQMGMFPFCSNLIRYYAGWCTKIAGDTLPSSPFGLAPDEEVLTYTLKEPIGVVGAITPWNFPVGMLVLKLGPALATGCTLVIKPAEQTPLTAALLGRLIQEAGFPDGVVNIVNGHGEEAGAALSAHDGVDKISFTGSTQVGKLIINAATGNLKKVSLELGGKSPVVVFPDADFEKAIPGALRAAFFLQGQNCMAGTRLFVHEKAYDPFIEGLAEAMNFFKLGPGMDMETNLGPLISATQKERVMGFIDKGQQEGAELVRGGGAPDLPGYFVEPTLFSCPNGELTIVKNEIFGPVLCAERFGDDDLDEIAARANSTIYGLSGSVWTKDLSTAHKLAKRIDSGQVGINVHAALDPATPFGGNKQSGWGREFGKEALDLYLKVKSDYCCFVTSLTASIK